MANYLKSMIEVHGNEAVVAKVDELLKDVKYNDVASFARAFYENVEVTETDGVLNTWSVDNLGSKWTYLYDIMGDGEFSIESAWYPPLRFFTHLYNMMVEIDPEVFIEVRYEDEAYNPIGGVVIKKNSEGEARLYQEEDDEYEYPDEDDYYDEEEEDTDYDAYESATMDFMDEVGQRQSEMVLFCHDMIDEGDGDLIDDVE
jgi:hypothetical protein